VTGATAEQHAAMRYVCTHTTPCVVHGLAGFAWVRVLSVRSEPDLGM
jgi:hypothetical protein